MEMIKLSGKAQADSLREMNFDAGQFLNPVEDINGDWFISEQEYENPIFAQVMIQFSANERKEFIPKPIQI